MFKFRGKVKIKVWVFDTKLLYIKKNSLDIFHISEVNAENLTKTKAPTNTEMPKTSGKRKRRIYSWELETEQNIPNKHFKADTKQVKEEPKQLLESLIDIKHESSNRDPLEG